MGRPNKQDAQQVHAARRFAERLPPNAPTPEQIGQTIRRQESLESWADTNRVVLHVLLVCNRIEIFVYDRQRHQVVTVLPGSDRRVQKMRRKHRAHVSERIPHVEDSARLAS